MFHVIDTLTSIPSWYLCAISEISLCFFVKASTSLPCLHASNGLDLLLKGGMFALSILLKPLKGFLSAALKQFTSNFAYFASSYIGHATGVWQDFLVCPLDNC